MEEETTTNAPDNQGGQSINGIAIDDQGMAIPQPEVSESAAAVETTDETPAEQPEVADTNEEPSADDNSTDEWLKNKGIDPGSPEAIRKVADMARNAEKTMHAKAQKASELEKAIDTGITEEAQIQGLSDDDRLDIVRIKTKLNVREFFDNNPDAKSYEQAMIAELANKPHLAGDLESLYANAVVKSGGVGQLKSQGKREALETLAQKQQAAAPRGNAVNSSPTGGSKLTPQNVDQMVAGMTSEEYRRRLPEINRAIAG